MIMCLMVAGLAHMMWVDSSLDTQITTNQLRESQVRMAAMSGIQHFLALDYNPDDYIHESVIVPETSLTSRLSYTVTIYILGDQRALLVSRGLYKKANKLVFEHPTKILVEW